MQIKVDKAGEQVILQLLDVFLKVNGINALNSVNQIKASITPIEENLEPKEKENGTKTK